MKRWNRAFLVIALAVAGGFGVTRADTFTATPEDQTGGSTVVQNADGSFTLTTTAGNKASLDFYTGSDLGTLHDLVNGGNFSATFNTGSADAGAPNNELAFRFFLNGTTTSLVWENTSQPTEATPSSVFQTVNFTTGDFWEHSKIGVSSNFNGGGQPQPLSTWDSGSIHYIVDGNGNSAINVPISDSDVITSIQVSYGSGLGAFTGTVEDLKMSFGSGGPSFVGAAVTATPLPASVWQGAVLLGGMGVFAAAKRRKPVPAL